MARRGTFIVIEGTDGSGKATQFALLRDRLQTAGYDVETFDFPQYSQESSYFVRQYLDGKYGPANDIGPYTSSLFYALDRYEAASKIRAALDKGKIVLSNRYTGSSMGHQGTKFNSAEQRRGFFIWLDNLEFEMLRIPRPDVSFVLRVPADIASELIDKRIREDSTKKRDIHESDFTHLERAVTVYDDLCQLFPKDFKRIDCVRGDKLLDVETIQHMLWEKASPLLPTPPQIEMPMPATKSTATSRPAQTSVPAPKPPTESDGAQEGTAADHAEEPKPTASETAPASDGAAARQPQAPAHKKEYITNQSGKVYAFTDALHPQLVAAVMATLSHSSGILSTTVLKAFGEAAEKDKTFLKRVLDTYADDSVRNHVHQQVVVTGASALLAKKLEWGRAAAYTKPKIQFMRPEQKDTEGNYKYFVPTGFNEAIAALYRKHMDYMFETYELVYDRLLAYLQTDSETPEAGRNAAWKTALEADARAALQGIVPISHTATVGVYSSAHGFEKLIIQLLGDELPEAQQAGEQILHELRKTIPAFLEDVDRPEIGGSETVYQADTHRDIEQFAKVHIKEQYAPQTSPIQLTDVWPRNELDLVPDMLYAATNLPLSELRTKVAAWPYFNREEAFMAYLGDRLNRHELPGHALEKARYSWDVQTSFSVFRDLQQQAVDDLEWQPLTPRVGYEVPQIIEEAELSDEYEDSFDTSLMLHSKLIEAGYALEAQYATLAGHRLRWKFTQNARQAMHFMELHTGQDTTPETRYFVEAMHDRLGEVHPLIANSMQFVGQPEDPELNQLATERYKQYKNSRKT